MKGQPLSGCALTLKGATFRVYVDGSDMQRRVGSVQGENEKKKKMISCTIPGSQEAATRTKQGGHRKMILPVGTVVLRKFFNVFKLHESYSYACPRRFYSHLPWLLVSDRPATLPTLPRLVTYWKHSGCRLGIRPASN